MHSPDESRVVADDVVTLAQARWVAVMLGLDPMELSVGCPLPRGWHFVILAGETSRPNLRSDGFPGLGVTMPELDLPRLLLGQRKCRFEGDIAVGAPVKRESSIVDIAEKTGRNGPLAIVSVEHSLSSTDVTTQIHESQTYFLAKLPSLGSATTQPSQTVPAFPEREGTRKVVTPDDLMLFQYSALGFNTHRIHFDRSYATHIEGYPDLVVNGGLATLLATEFLRVDLGMTVKTLSAHHRAPLYVNRPMTILLTEQLDGDAKIALLDCDGLVAAELALTFDGV